jgi:4-hydroxybenzoate polyprenyltransferase
MTIDPSKVVVVPAARVRPRSWGGFVVANLALTRFYTVLPLALLSLGIAVDAGVEPVRAAVVVAAIACAVAGGYAYNDLRDQRLDRHNRPRRPIVSGRLSERYVHHLVYALFGGALLVALTSRSWRTVVFMTLLIVSSHLYSDSLKSIPGVKNAFVGLWCGVLPYGAALDVVKAEAVVPAIAILGLFITQKELFADIYDLDGDVAAGVRTIPALIGVRGALVLVGLLNVASFLFVRLTSAVPAIPGLPAAAVFVTCVNVVGLLLLSCRITRTTIRAFLEVQKLFLIGGCVALFAMLAR